MFIRIGQSRYLNSNIMIYAMKKVLMECMDIYKKHGLKSITVVKTSEDRLTNIAVWENNPGENVFKALGKIYTEAFKKYEAQQVTNETEVVLVWEKEKGFVINKE